MVFQNYALYPHMTVRENMGFGLKLAKAPKAEIARRVEEVARTLDLTEHLERKPAKLSGGQRQRVAMGRAIIRQPKAFLMDEPLSNLDAKLRVQMRAELARLQQAVGTTTIYVTHDQTEAMTLGDRVAVMRAGVIQQVDAPKALYDDPVNLFVAGFIGSPAMNFVPARVEDDVLRLPFGDVALAGRWTSRRDLPREVIAGVRPEHFEDASIPSAGHDRLRFRTKASVVESLGSELYVYFDVGGGGVDQHGLTDLLTEARGELPTGIGRDQTQVVARLDPASRAAVGAELELSLDVSQIKLFDPATGDSLSQQSSPANGRPGWTVATAV
jgi:multiple sugar transport system ATP-binding protein